jgi:signal transduction histidine kinase
MIPPPLPQNEPERLKELYRYEVLDTAYEQEFNEIVQLASRICNVPMSLISLVDHDRQWFKAKVGVDLTETQRNVSFCGYTILGSEVFVVPDTLVDERFADNPLVKAIPKIRYYAGVPLVTRSGYNLGSLCVLDREPRHLDEEQLFALSVLSRNVVKLLELRTMNKELNRISEVQQITMAIMAHDIRAPLASLKSTYDVKAEGLLSPEDEAEIDELVLRQLDSILLLLNNISDWGKLQLEDDYEMVDTNIHELANQCAGYFLLAAEHKKNKILNRVAPDFHAVINAQCFEFVLRNLIGNANKFTENGTIAIDIRVENGRALLEVSDTGTGMTPEQLSALEKKVYFKSTPGTRKEKGSGLGLKLVNRYLSKVGGAMSFTSEQGKGTTAIVSIPFRGED